MIRLTAAQYEAIGRVAVQSGLLERELNEYLARLNAAPTDRTGLTGKIRALRRVLAGSSLGGAATEAFNFVLDYLATLVDERNALAHGVWSTRTNAPLMTEETSASLRSTTVRAEEVTAVAEALRYGRKLLLRLCHDHYPIAAGAKKCPRPLASRLRSQLMRTRPRSL